MANKLEVGPAEAGQSILRFLERRLNCPKASIYRWLRSGEIRVNGGRGKPDRVLKAGDLVRVPPQAGDESTPSLAACVIAQEALGDDLAIIFQDDELLVLDKPYGLPVHGGTRHKDSLAARLKKACAEGEYVPAPAHRLDLHASGLILAGKTHAAQTALHELFRESKLELEREYLCWVRGNASVTFAEPTLCADWLAEQLDSKGRERMAVVDEGGPNNPKEARAIYHCLEVREDAKFGTVSLIRARLLTGRKHQIRVQLASRRYPLLGDWRYGGSRLVSMMLHASRMVVPGPRPRVFASAPRWAGIFSVGDEHVQDAAV